MNSTEIVTKESLRHTLYAGSDKEAIVLLYSKYSAMLYGYILKFVPDVKDAEQLLVKLFTGLAGKLEEAFSSSLNIYCWLQLHARELVLGNIHLRDERVTITACMALLRGAPAGVQQVFEEVYLKGRSRTETAVMMHKTEPEITQLLFMALTIIRSKIS
ncbi:hypothetical protein ACTHGU_06175 [Chitinophagaceae bacterium MMS25-I14]